MTPELELPDDADAKRETLRTLAAYRRQVLRQAAQILRDRDVPYLGPYQMGWRDAAEALLELADD